MKRREFLTNSITASAVVLAIPTAGMAKAFGQTLGSGAASQGAAASADRHMSRAYFERLLHTRFRIKAAGQEPVIAKLIAVKGRGSRKSAERLEQFSTIFELPSGAHVTGLCSIEHATAGRFELLLDQPVRSTLAHTCQAQFSHRIA
jgi:hypothetical protein